MKEREENYEYPPRLQIDCIQLDSSSSLLSSFVVSKKSTAMEEKDVVKFTLKKNITGTYIYVCTYICMYASCNYQSGLCIADFGTVFIFSLHHH